MTKIKVHGQVFKASNKFFFILFKEDAGKESFKVHSYAVYDSEEETKEYADKLASKLGLKIVWY